MSSKRDRRRHRQAHKRASFNPKAPVRPRGANQVYYFKDGFLSMSQEAAKRFYVAKTKRQIHNTPFFYSVCALSAVSVLGMATLYISEEECQRALDAQEVGLAAKFEIVNLFDYLCTRIDAREDVAQEEASFDELGIADSQMTGEEE